MIKVEKEYPLFKSKFQFQGIITTCCFVLQNVLCTMKKYFIAIPSKFPCIENNEN